MRHKLTFFKYWVKNYLEQGLSSVSWRRKWQLLPSLAWRIPRTEEPGRLQSVGVSESDMSEHAHTEVVFGERVEKKAPGNHT